jgi:hypothetical protein
MSEFKTDVEKLSESIKHHEIDWELIKEIICGISHTLQGICAVLPPGLPKTIICTAASLLSFACSQSSKDFTEQQKSC